MPNGRGGGFVEGLGRYWWVLLLAGLVGFGVGLLSATFFQAEELVPSVPEPPSIPDTSPPPPLPLPPPPIPLDRGGNTCDWPNLVCASGQRAVEMLDRISAWAIEAEAQGHISPEKNAAIQQAVGRAKDPNLRNARGTHVCAVRSPDACTELTGIYQSARQATGAAAPTVAEPQWDAVLGGLQGFPSGN